MERTEILDQLDLDKFESRRIYHLRVCISQDGVGSDLCVPVIVAKGRKEGGPVLGVTAAIHGDEINGLPIIHHLIDGLDLDDLYGTLVCVPVVNVPGYLANTREFSDGQDLNRIMPGKAVGNEGQMYAHRFLERVAKHFDYLVDLHTASFGRINSLYVRANMKHPVVKTLAELIRAEIVLHNEGGDGTFRNAVSDLNIPTITVEVGDPNRFQKDKIRSALRGLQRIMNHLKMHQIPLTSDDEGEDSGEDEEAIKCKHSYWIYTNRGGILVVRPKLVDFVEKGQSIAVLKDVFGNKVKEYYAPERGVVVGKSVNPVAHAGARILHLGIPE